MNYSNLNWQLTIGNISTLMTTSSTSAYAIPFVSNFSNNENLLTVGGETIKIHGENFGPTTEVFVSAVYGHNRNLIFTASQCKITVKNIGKKANIFA